MYYYYWLYDLYVYDFFLGSEHSTAHLITSFMRKCKLFITQQNCETVKGQIQLTR